VLSFSDLTYRITVVNAGAVDATGVVLTDQTPTGTTFVSASPSQECSHASTVTCTLGVLPAASLSTVTIVVRVVAKSGTLTDTATVSGTPDPIPSNDSLTTTVTVA